MKIKNDAMTDLNPDKIRNMLGAHNDGVYLLGQRDNIGDIVAFLLAENERLAKQVYVPGLWKCAKCSCQVVSNYMSAESGQMAANNDPQRCPNDCGPMWRVTERDAGNAAVDRLAALSDENKILRDATAPRAEVKGCPSLILYFDDEQEREDFVTLFQQAKPNARSYKI